MSSTTTAVSRKIHWSREILDPHLSGHWSEIHEDLGLRIGNLKPGIHGPCPMKGGTNKFRKFPNYNESGGCVSNEDDSFATGYHVLAWFHNCSFSDAICMVGDLLHRLGVVEPPAKGGAGKRKTNGRKFETPKAASSQGEGKPANGTSKVAKAIKDLKLEPANPKNALHHAVVQKFCEARKGILPETIWNAGVRIGKWYSGSMILAMPAYSSGTKEPTAFILYLASGEPFPAYESLPERKVHLLKERGTPDGWFIAGGISRAKQARTIYKVEGSTDALSLAGIVPADSAVVTNVLGAQPKWTGKTAPNFEIVKDKRLIGIGDNDPSGQGIKSVRTFLEVAAQHSVTALLPTLPDGFKDVRDWITAGNGWHELEDLVASAEVIQPPDESQVQPGKGESAGPANAAGLTERTLEDEDLTDIGNARHFWHRNENRLRYCYPWKKWLAWAGSHWNADADRAALRLAKDTIDEIFSLAAIKKSQKGFDFAMSSSRLPRIEAMMKLAACEMSVSPGDLDQNQWLLNCQNGTIDLRTGTLREHLQEDYLTKCCPTKFDPAAESPVFHRFIAELFGGNEMMVEFIRRLMGYAITGSVREQVLPIFWGSGSNGKSTFLNAIQTVLGGDFATTAPHDFLIEKHGDQHPTEQADLFGRRLVICSETGDSKRLAESLVKSLTGGERIRARRMREDFWEFDPTHKLILMTNHRPIVRGGDHGIWRRLLLVPFVEQFKGDRVDGLLSEKLLAERSGILSWMVQGCVAWLKEGLNPPDCVRVATDEYRSQEDAVGRFVEACCIRGNIYEIRFKTFFERLESWCEETGDYLPPKRAVGLWLTDNGFEKYSSNGTVYRGLHLVPMQVGENF